MRIVYVWIFAFTLAFIITVGWWVSLPIIAGVSAGLNSSITDPNAINIATAVSYVSYAWGPLFDIFIVAWALLNSQAKDVESEVYGY
jgi:phage shock protein PspC (stress-responsive transcriptional regulator)